MQLDQAMLDTVRQYFAALSRDITLVLATGEHARRDELKTFLAQIVATSPRLSLIEQADAALTSPYKCVLSLVARLVQNFVSIAIHTG